MFKLTLRQHLEKFFKSQELARWFDPLGFALDDSLGILRVSFPHSFFGNWFLVNVRRDFERQASSLTKDMTIVYETERESLLPTSGERGAASRFAPFFFPDDNPRRLKSLSGDNTADGQNPAPRSSAGSLSEIVVPEHFTFANFLVNRKNDFPLAAAKECLAENAPSLYSPFVVHGPSGVGKSHLLGAMANAARAAKRPFFYGDVTYLQRINIAAGRFAPVDEEMVFLDDAQRVGACARLQDALVALIDMFQTSRRLLALSFDKTPKSCPELGQKLLSRLTSGLVVEVKKADLDVRRQYLQRENNARMLGLSKEQILTLSQRYQDIRAIDGALRRLSAYRSLLHGKDRISDVNSLIEREEGQSALTPASIIQVVARHFSLPPEEISGKCRTKSASRARHIAILLCRELLGLSLVQTGRIFAGRDHSSVLYSLKKIKQLQENNKDMHKQVEELRKLCLARP